MPSLPPPPTPAPDGPLFISCTVSDGLTDTPYRRAGRGAPVVVLTAGASRAEDALLAALPRQFRVIAPEVPPPATSTGEALPGFPAWLGGFLDGLGLSRVALVAEERFGAAALGFALLEPARVEQLVVVLYGPGGGEGGTASVAGAEQPPPLAAVADSLRRAGMPILVSWLLAGDAGAAAVAEIARFLATTG